ncbi:MAG TPA: DNA-processing protein DprA, partial [Chthoniobacterales bacterium]
SFGTLVVEAGLNSGALITANQAAEQGRSLYVVPGRIDHPSAFGSNRLIQQGAKLVMSAQDILDDLGMLFSKVPDLPAHTPAVELSGEERRIYEALGNDERTVDEIVAKSGLPSPIVSSTLLGFEMRHLAKARPGGRYVRLI